MLIDHDREVDGEMEDRLRSMVQRKKTRVTSEKMNVEWNEKLKTNVQQKQRTHSEHIYAEIIQQKTVST